MGDKRKRAIELFDALCEEDLRDAGEIETRDLSKYYEIEEKLIGVLGEYVLVLEDGERCIYEVDSGIVEARLDVGELMK